MTQPYEQARRVSRRLVKPTTAARVRSAMVHHGYQPNVLARNATDGIGAGRMVVDHLALGALALKG